MLEFADELEPLGTEHVSWARAHVKTPVWLAEVTLAETTRLVGAFVTPARDVLGLRAWDDADDGIDPVPWALFDVEKLVRMALHQSGLAFEALVSSKAWGGLDTRAIASATVTSGVLHYYRDVTGVLADGRPESWRWRTLLTGALLAREGVVSQSLDTLSSRLGVSASYNPADFQTLTATIDDGSALPERPTDYDFVNDLVVDLRLGAS